MQKIFDMLAEIRPEHDFTNSQNFIEDGMLDSFDVIALTAMVEEEYGVKIDGLDILPENYCNAEAIAALIVKSGGSV